MHRSCGRVAAIVVAVALLGACGSSSPPRAQGEPATTTAATAPTTATPASTTTAAPAPADPALTKAGAAGQAIVVTADRYGTTTATLAAYERDGAGGWKRVFGPWSARVGTRGLAPPDEKREGDGRTPSGVYGFDFFFGVAPDPGVRFPYRRVTGKSIVWDDDPASPLYNTWVDLDRQQAGAGPEPMYVSPAYDHGAVIAYNTARTPGLGSAIFLHVSNGGPTAGCVSLPAGQLVEVLRWLDPARTPRIVLGVAG
ncbi:MAG: L,D-transpeptidase family protein [Actinomycetota bacterium]|nr:L,D-transpeptidase family protein [Actinomycetota bacterium]